MTKVSEIIKLLRDLDDRGWYHLGVVMIIFLVIFTLLLQGFFEAVWTLLLVNFGIHVGSSKEAAKWVDNTELTV